MPNRTTLALTPGVDLWARPLCFGCNPPPGFAPLGFEHPHQSYQSRYDIESQSELFFHQPDDPKYGSWEYRKVNSFGLKSKSWPNFKQELAALTEENSKQGWQTGVISLLRHEEATSNARAQEFPDLAKLDLHYVESTRDAPLTIRGEERAAGLTDFVKANAEKGMLLPDPRMLFSSPQTRAIQTAQKVLDSSYPKLTLNITRDFGEIRHQNPCDIQSTLTELKNAFGSLVCPIQGMPENDEIWRCLDCSNRYALTITDERDPRSDQIRPVLQTMPSLRGADWTEIAPKVYRRETVDDMQTRNRRGFEQALDRYRAVQAQDPIVQPTFILSGHSSQLGALNRGSLGKFPDIPHGKNWTQLKNGEWRCEVFRYRLKVMSPVAGGGQPLESMWPDNLLLDPPMTSTVS